MSTQLHWPSPVPSGAPPRSRELVLVALSSGDAAGEDLEPTLGDQGVDDLAGDLLVGIGEFCQFCEPVSELAEVVAFQDLAGRTVAHQVVGAHLEDVGEPDEGVDRGRDPAGIC